MRRALDGAIPMWSAIVKGVLIGGLILIVYLALHPEHVGQFLAEVVMLAPNLFKHWLQQVRAAFSAKL